VEDSYSLLTALKALGLQEAKATLQPINPSTFTEDASSDSIFMYKQFYTKIYTAMIKAVIRETPTCSFVYSNTGNNASSLTESLYPAQASTTTVPTVKPAELLKVLNKSGIYVFWQLRHTASDSSRLISHHVMCFIHHGSTFIFFDPENGIATFESFNDFQKWFMQENLTGSLNYMTKPASYSTPVKKILYFAAWRYETPTDVMLNSITADSLD
tara:strand:- start:172 stop:813 length:642 start_codon:yes stop_codon:yes gene_type:complete